MTTVGVFAAMFDDEHRILCVRRNYPPHNWTLPGGRLEPGESPLLGLQREVREETGLVVEPGRFVGVYAAPFKDDIVLFFEATVLERGTWRPDGEIAERRFFSRADIPGDVTIRTRARIDDAFDATDVVFRVFERTLG
jgi:ADP-ribose pyrophosphatase YjhB (NUDIX family)